MTVRSISGELFGDDLRAFWPAPGGDLRAVIASDRPCERKPSGKDCVSKRAYWYRVNHLFLSLCRFHAAQLARRKGVLVVPALQEH